MSEIVDTIGLLCAVTAAWFAGRERGLRKGEEAGYWRGYRSVQLPKFDFKPNDPKQQRVIADMVGKHARRQS